MIKISKKEYNAEVKRVNEAIEVLKRVQEKQSQIAQNQENDLQIRDVAGDNWNTLEDSIYLLQEELKDLEHRWETRDWTTSEWMEYDLVSNNID